MTAPLRKTAAKPSATGAAAATTVPKPTSRMSRISGKPIDSPRWSCCFEISWKFDQTAAEPSRRVDTAGVSATSWWRRSVATSSVLSIRPL